MPYALGEGVDEPGASGQQVVGGSFVRAEHVGEQRARRREHAVRCDRGDDEVIDRRRFNAGSLQRLACRGQCEVRHGLLGRGDAALADARPLADPLIRRIDRAGELLVRQHPLGRIGAEPGNPHGDAGRCCSDHRSTAKVSLARAASSPSTVAVARPRPMGPRTRSRSQVGSTSLPGSTMRLKRQSSMPRRARACPGARSPRAARPRRLGRCLDEQHARHHRPSGEVARQVPTRRRALSFSARARSPGASSSTSSIRRNSSRCGMIRSISSRPNGSSPSGR